MKDFYNEIKQSETDLKEKFDEIENIALFNQKKVLNAFLETGVQTHHLAGTTGYGYSDKGRFGLYSVFAKTFKAEDAFVSTNMATGTTALYTALFALLRPNDTFISISGKPYDTLDEVINGESNGSLKEYNIKYKQIELANGEFDKTEIIKQVKALKPKLLFIQRSRGYSLRGSLNISKLEAIITEIRKADKKVVIMVDNCYGEFTEIKEPTEAGADLIVGSLIKNPGGSLAPTGAYFAGTKTVIEQIASRVNSCGLGNEVGSLEHGYRNYLQGFFMAPHVVSGVMKGMLLISHILTERGYNVLPKKDDVLSDIVVSIQFNDENKLVEFCKTVQKFSPIDSTVVPFPWDMPGYSNQVIMAAGTFVSGATLEMSADAPIRPPYIAYMQGGITYEHIKIVLNEILKTI